MLNFCLGLIIVCLSCNAIAALGYSNSECVMTATEKCDASTFGRRSTLVYPGGRTRCAFENDGKVGPKANSTYFFHVLPGRSHDKNKVMLNFQGGGACITESQCRFESQCRQRRPDWSIHAYTESTGVFNISNPQNPYKDWTIIHVLYCTGDTHMGDYIRRAPPSVTNNKCGQLELDAYHVGAVNTAAVLKWMYRNYPDPEKLVLTGCSAGSVAVQFHAHNIIQTYQKVLKSKADITVIADSFVGTTPTPFGISVFLNNFKACDFGYGQSRTMIKLCKKGKLKSTDLLKHIIKQHSKIPFSFVNSKDDPVQLHFYLLFPNAKRINTAQFYKKMNQLLASHTQNTSNVVSYMIDGKAHCVSTRNTFYTAKIRDPVSNKYKSLPEWMIQLSEGKSPVYSQCAGVLKNSLKMTSAIPDTKWCDSNLMNSVFRRNHNKC